MYNKTIIEFGFPMISWIIKTEVCVICLSLRLRQIIQTRGFDNSWYHTQPHPIIVYYHSKQIFLSFHWPRAHLVTCKINNCLQIMVCSCANAVQQCLAANHILLMRKGNRAFLLLGMAVAWKMADRFASQGYNSIKNKLSVRLNDKTILLLNSVIAKYRDFRSASANNWSACHRQIMVFCSTLFNNCSLVSSSNNIL